MVIGVLYDLVSYYFSGYTNNSPKKVFNNTEEEIQDVSKNLRKVMSEKDRLEIEYNANRTDHIRTEEETKNNKPLNELELKKIKNERIMVINLKSMDLKNCIKNLNKVNIEEENISEEDEDEDYYNTSSFFNNLKKYAIDNDEIRINNNEIFIENSENTMKNLSMVFSELKLEEDEDLVNMINSKNASIQINID